MDALDSKDGGLGSRKLWFAVGVCALIFAGACLSTYFTGLRVNFDAMVGGLLGALGIYAGANVGVKWSLHKNLKGKPEPAPEPEAEPEVEDDPEEGERC